MGKSQYRSNSWAHFMNGYLDGQSEMQEQGIKAMEEELRQRMKNAPIQTSSDVQANHDEEKPSRTESPVSKSVKKKEEAVKKVSGPAPSAQTSESLSAALRSEKMAGASRSDLMPGSSASAGQTKKPDPVQETGTAEKTAPSSLSIDWNDPRQTFNHLNAFFKEADTRAVQAGQSSMERFAEQLLQEESVKQDAVLAAVLHTLDAHQQKTDGFTLPRPRDICPLSEADEVRIEAMGSALARSAPSLFLPSAAYEVLLFPSPNTALKNYYETRWCADLVSAACRRLSLKPARQEAVQASLRLKALWKLRTSYEVCLLKAGISGALRPQQEKLLSLAENLRSVVIRRSVYAEAVKRLAAVSEMEVERLRQTCAERKENELPVWTELFAPDREDGSRFQDADKLSCQKLLAASYKLSCMALVREKGISAREYLQMVQEAEETKSMPPFTELLNPARYQEGGKLRLKAADINRMLS